ncbi:MAG: two-component regulator propeller domain-containing protein, partial [Niabella sp.]
MASKFSYYKIVFLFILLQFLTVSSLLTQRVNEVINTSRGLVNNEVTAVFQDKMGFMWFGTSSGLCRYDGYSIKLITGIRNNKGIELRQAITILEEGIGSQVWVGTKNEGLISYDYETGVIKSISKSLKKNQQFDPYIISVYQRNANEVFIGTWSSFEIFNIRDSTIKVISTGFGVNNIVPDAQQGLWLATNKGLLYFDYKKRSLKKIQLKIGKIDIASMALDNRNNRLLLGTWGQGIIAYNYITSQIKRIPIHIIQNESLGINAIYKLFIDVNGTIWASAWGTGLFKMSVNDSSFYKVPLEAEYSSKNDDKIIYSLTQDKYGMIWVGTDGAGIFKIDTNKSGFEKIINRPNKIYAINSNHVLAVLVDDKNILWAGFRGGGLQYSTDGKNFKTVPVSSQRNTKRLDVVNCLLKDGNFLWLGTSYGLHKLEIQIVNQETNSVKVRTISSLLKADKIKSLLKDSYGNLWVGTQEDYLKVIPNVDSQKPNSIIYFKPDTNKIAYFKNVQINCLFEDSRKKIWIGTNKGLYYYNPVSKNVREISLQENELDGLSNNTITCIKENKQGVIWIGTHMGVFKLKRTNNDAFLKEHLLNNESLPNAIIQSIEI